MVKKKHKETEGSLPVYLISWEEETEAFSREWDYRVSYLPPVRGGKEIFVRAPAERGRGI